MSKRIHKVLVTGAAGFIGSEFVRWGVKNNLKISAVDKLTYAGDVSRIADLHNKIIFYRADVARLEEMEKIFKQQRPQVVIHFAAETHVDRSIQDVSPFIQTNIIGTQNLIDLCISFKIQKFLYISTDEVYGESREGRFKENSPLRPGNPYSATKASAEILIGAAMQTHQFPAVIIRPANNYGPWQYPEKLVPVVILKALKNQRVPVYGRGKQIREWLYVSDCAEAVGLILKKGYLGETYNVGSYSEQENIQTVKSLLKILGKSQRLIRFVQDRPGHDFRYSVDCSKLRRLGWKPKVTLSQGMRKTVQWYVNNLDWMEKKMSFLEAYWKTVYKE